MVEYLTFLPPRGLDPDNNMCNKRIKALYKKAKDVENQGFVTVCNPDSDLYPR